MSIVSSFFNQTIDYVYTVALDSYSDVVRTEKYNSLSCRWVEKITTVVNKQGTQVNSRISVWLEGDVSISDTDEVVSGTNTYKIASIETARDLAGNIDHIKLYLV